MEARLAKMELAMANTLEGVDLIEQGMEKGLKDLREQIQDLHEGVKGEGLGCVHGDPRPGDSIGASHLGKRDVKELNNFLWYIERYFEAIALMDEAIKNMKRHKHMGSIRENVKEFSMLIPEISNMSEDELLFNFIDNLQSWAKQELRRRGVQDLATAMAVADSLWNIDYYSKSAIL
ncbi:hypothetical protein CK203_110607 [Vitis vinifera]|uniref:Uncharacterized protein n=1 Tax=Vitis vinifera TaxID=29760 RepID=A0A438CBV3_VITVI|nr:hypothetical protein CK203_110607 [Vitis vinifera]